MDNYTATMICEGVFDTASEEQYVEAWQQLHDTGLAYQLQGWFGRSAVYMLQEGIIIDKR